MNGMTGINEQARAAQDAARRGDGRFGDQVRTEPEVGLAAAKTGGVFLADDVEYGSDEKAYPSLRGYDRIRDACGKCGGSGVYTAPSSISFYTSATKTNTTGCFDCMGTGYYERKVSSIRARARRDAKEAAERAAESARMRPLIEAWHAKGYSELMQQGETFAMSLYHRDPRSTEARELLDKLNHYDVDDSVADRLREMIQAEKDRLAAPSPIPEGKATVVATFISSKVTSGFRGSRLLKMTVALADGGRVFGTYPTKLDAWAGDVFEMTATFERSKDDPEFGFFKSPKLVRVISQAPRDE